MFACRLQDSGCHFVLNLGWVLFRFLFLADPQDV